MQDAASTANATMAPSAFDSTTTALLPPLHTFSTHNSRNVFPILFNREKCVLARPQQQSQRHHLHCAEPAPTPSAFIYKTFCNGRPMFYKRLALANLLQGHQGCVNTVAWNETGTLLVSGSDDTQLKIWTNPMINLHCPPQSKQQSHATTSSGGAASSSQQSQQSTLSSHVNIDTGHMGNIFCALFVPNTSDTRVVSCAADDVVRLFDVTTQKSVAKFRGHNNMVHKLVVDYDNSNLFLTASNDGTCREFDMRQPDTSIIMSDLRKPKLYVCVVFQ